MAIRQIVISKNEISLREGKDSKVVGRLRGWDGEVYSADLETEKRSLKISAATHKGLKKIVDKEFNWMQGDNFEPKKRQKRMSMAEMKILLGI